jgi:four helix bundle protein
VRSYRELKVWELGIDITLAVYRLTSKFPANELYGLTSQLRRSASSIPANIAEGHARGATKDLLRFLSIARGSLAEVETHLIIAQRLGYGTEQEIEAIQRMAEEENRMLAGLRKSLQAKL